MSWSVLTLETAVADAMASTMSGTLGNSCVGRHVVESAVLLMTSWYGMPSMRTKLCVVPFCSKVTLPSNVMCIENWRKSQVLRRTEQLGEWSEVTARTCIL
ncbi:hypothetical protein PR002_g11613 [Phytophthora rubi]|uniref:Uncharacterized protein n=1 Tax=Phytophthora rubi TaxID=129364 RepID=A0A6A3M1W5_9STRA|nr:hypothetical protein PR002_g11613 [Phytophthora rubi]